MIAAPNVDTINILDVAILSKHCRGAKKKSQLPCKQWWN